MPPRVNMVRQCRRAASPDRSVRNRIEPYLVISREQTRRFDKEWPAEGHLFISVLA